MACRAAAAAMNDTGLWAFVLVVDGWSAVVTGTSLCCHHLDDIAFVIHWTTCYNGVSEAHWQQRPNLLEVFSRC
ncbi:hypothetical protein GCM10014715_46880 [Streptomyces spiralis]|jgi:hypothetical protein|uniref:Uncharacterized protein n=1 Tax=Streptomyces spiralis TaxID=66376 RepID=A0A919A431_9ACTN|nr:hypothetical protein GCM10014715_46880 [Streptomyces spiralis]